MITATAACNEPATRNSQTPEDTMIEKPEIPLVNPFEQDSVAQADTLVQDTATYQNKRFRTVKVRRLSSDQFEVTGKAQVFEASFSWVLEDGHHVLKEGHETTDAGAPEFGNFRFKLTAQKRDSNSTLHLILFEASAKDGSRQHELPIPLY